MSSEVAPAEAAPLAPQAPADAAAVAAAARQLPLKMVVADAVHRWFEDTYQEAQRGDVKQAALLGQMLAEGYGCERDPVAAREWIERAKSRGYRMSGVYCEL